MAYKGGDTQGISADFDRETEAFDFYRMVVSEMMTVDDVRETIIPTRLQRAYLLDNARPKERETLLAVFKAREETWKLFMQFVDDKKAVKQFVKKRWKPQRKYGAKRVDNNQRKK